MTRIKIHCSNVMNMQKSANWSHRPKGQNSTIFDSFRRSITKNWQQQKTSCWLHPYSKPLLFIILSDKTFCPHLPAPEKKPLIPNVPLELYYLLLLDLTRLFIAKQIPVKPLGKKHIKFFFLVVGPIKFCPPPLLA